MTSIWLVLTSLFRYGSSQMPYQIVTSLNSLPVEHTGEIGVGMCAFKNGHKTRFMAITDSQCLVLTKEDFDFVVAGYEVYSRSVVY